MKINVSSIKQTKYDIKDKNKIFFAYDKISLSFFIAGFSVSQIRFLPSPKIESSNLISRTNLNSPP